MNMNRKTTRVSLRKRSFACIGFVAAMGMITVFAIGYGRADAATRGAKGTRLSARTHLHVVPSATPLPMLIQGRVVAIDGDRVTVKTPDHGPGLNHGPGIHSMLIALGKTYTVDVSTATFETWDGTRTPKFKPVVGDSVIVMLKSSASPQSGVAGAASPVTFSAVVIETAVPVAGRPPTP